MACLLAVVCLKPQSVSLKKLINALKHMSAQKPQRKNTMDKVTHTACQWIGTTEPYARLESTCCTATVQGRAYCEEHLWRVYQKGTAVHRRKDTRVANDIRTWESLFNEAVEELEQEGFL